MQPRLATILLAFVITGLLLTGTVLATGFDSIPGQGVDLSARNLAHQAITGEIPTDAYLHPVDRILHRVLDRN